MIKGVVFENQTPTAAAHRGIFGSVLTDGALAGCAVTYSAGTATIGAGFFSISGGVIEIVGSETVSVEGSTGYARIKAVVDPSGTATKEAFNQVTFAVDYAASIANLPALHAHSISDAPGTAYAAEVAVINLSTGAIVRTATAGPRVKYGTALPTTPGVAGEIFFKKV